MNQPQQSIPDGQKKQPSIFAAALAGIPPSVRRPPPPDAVRLHLLDDVPAAEAVAKEKSPTRRPQSR